MKKYIAKERLKASDLLPTKSPTDYKIYQLYNFVWDVDGAELASTVYSYSYQNSSK